MCETQLSEYTGIGMDIAINWQQGLYVKLSFRRGQQSFIFPIKLSDGWNAGALGYGVAVPSLAYVFVRKAVYEPWIERQLRRLRKKYCKKQN